MKFYEISYEERLELFYDYLTKLSVILLALEVVAKKREDSELDKVVGELKVAIEQLRDFILVPGKEE